MAAKFKFMIPKAIYETRYFRAPDARQIPTLRKIRRALRRGERNRRIIRTVIDDGMEHSYHATKGWRAVKV